MKLNLKTILIITFTSCAFSAMAQKDYVITNNGDTIRCKISTPFFTGIGSVKYKPLNAEESVKMDPDEVKEYRRGKKEIMESVLTGHNDKRQFMNLLERGKISIYYYNITTQMGAMGASTTTTYWYCGKQGADTVMALKTDSWSMSKSRKSRKEDFGIMLKDNSVVYNKYVADDKFSFEQLRKLIHLYNTGEELTDDKYRGY